MQKRNTNGLEVGQGLVEYALILVLVGVVVIVALSFLGSQVTDVFCRVISSLNTGPLPEACIPEDTDVVFITKASYDSGDQEVHLDATSNGDYNPDASLSASPGGAMEAKSDHYHLIITLTGCPCTVTVTSSEGGSATVTVGP